MASAMSNEEFKRKVLARIVRDHEWPVELLTTRQASKFRMKKGTLYRLWKLAPKEKRGGK